MRKRRKNFHYVYLLVHESGLYYLGKRSSVCVPAWDHYWGSGKLLWEVYRMFGYHDLKQGKPKGWEKHIVAVFDSERECSKYETEVIRAERPNELCLNCNGSGKLTR